MVASEPIDGLSALAPLLRVQPELQVFCRFGAQWEAPHHHERGGWAPFHMVAAGCCVLEVQGAARTTLEAGDIAVLPQGDAHTVHGPRPGARHTPPVTISTTSAIPVKANTDEAENELICGRLAFAQPHENLVRAALPRLMLLRTSNDAGNARPRQLLAAIRDELDASEPGALAICTDLASALLVMVLRAHFKHDAAAPSLLRLLGERHTARAVKAMLDDPGHSWTLDEFAEVAHTSRATLVRDFRRLADATPFAVLANLRLGVARRSLVESKRSLAEIAIEAGYKSQSAFSRAFQHRFEIAPSQVRQMRTSARLV